MDENINLNYDLDYSKDKTIDRRVLEVCAIAEANFLKGLKLKTKNITDIKDLIINNNNKDKNFQIMFSNNDTKKALETNRSYVQNKSYFSASKIGRIGNKSISLEKNLLSQRYYNNPKYQLNSNFGEFKNRLNTQIMKPKILNENYSNTKFYLKKNNTNNDQNKTFSNISKIKRNFNFKNRNQNQQFVNLINLNKKNSSDEELKSNNNIYQTTSSIKRQYKPLFSKTINKAYIFPHIQHIKNKNKYELNKILLKSENLIKHKKYLMAYNLLKETISCGEYHSDLFYLFGEVNRILKNYQNAENYLLLALNFEIHSPKVFYSMGLLYQDLKQYSYSNIFFKLYLRLIDSDYVHYLRAKNYTLMGEYLKAAKEMTVAIEMNNECDYYYKFRSEIYNKLGLKEISNEDFNMYQFIKNKKIEENK
jgi:hypothetical protein